MIRAPSTEPARLRDNLQEITLDDERKCVKCVRIDIEAALMVERSCYAGPGSRKRRRVELLWQIAVFMGGKFAS